MQTDLHIHTNRFSGCSNIEPVEALQQAKLLGLGAIALTEHGIQWPDEEIQNLLKYSGIKDLVIIPGQEVTCYSQSGKFQGEFLVFGYHESLGSNKSIQKVIKLVHSEGGVVVAAHPYKKNKNGVGFFGSGHSTVELEIDGLEIEHPAYDDECRSLALLAMSRGNFAGIGCSDAHELNDIGACRTIFETQIDSTSSLINSIRLKQVKALNFRKRHTSGSNL
jgi:predicted metal-dependent phosphoesterase TrpH